MRSAWMAAQLERAHPLFVHEKRQRQPGVQHQSACMLEHGAFHLPRLDLVQDTLVEATQFKGHSGSASRYVYFH